MQLFILSAGAAKGVVTGVQEDFRAATGAGIQPTFGAVGTIAGKLNAGEACDVVILTALMIDDLQRSGDVVAGSAAALGRVRTGIAVRYGDPIPDIASSDTLRTTLLSAPALYVPDTRRATAGIHFMNVLRRLGIDRQLEPRLREFPNGAAAMRELAFASDKGLLGCTQITEIMYTPGVTLAGALPAEFELATVYSAAVCSRAHEADLAWRFVQLVTGEQSRALRVRGGFEC